MNFRAHLILYTEAHTYLILVHVILAGFRTFHFGHFVSDNMTTVLPYRTMHICDQNQENLLSIKFSHIERVKPSLSEIVDKHISFCLYALILIHLHCMC